MPLKLPHHVPQVIVCCFGSEKYREQQQDMLDDAKEKCEAANLFFGDYLNIIVPTNTIDEWNRAMVYDLGDYFNNKYGMEFYALVLHPDGGIAHPEAFRDEWLDYDFIGSPFPIPSDDFSYRDVNGTIQRVGNSVSLRSKKLLQLPKKIGMQWRPFHGFYNEDGYITVNMRHIFEQHGCTFAPFEEAVHFGMETPLPEHEGIDSFVYHKNYGRNAQFPNYEI